MSIFSKDFTGEFQECPFSAKILQNAFCKDLIGECPECRLSAKILQNAFCGFSSVFMAFCKSSMFFLQKGCPPTRPV